MKQLLILVLVGSLAGCGGYHKAKRGGNAPTNAGTPTAVAPVAARVARPTATQGAPLVTARKPFARGPIDKACMASDRKARTRELCGCIQAVANDTLTSAQQRRAVGFYRDPHSAQEVRQSDNSGDEAFWKAYRDYGDRAARTCG